MTCIRCYSVIWNSFTALQNSLCFTNSCLLTSLLTSGNHWSFTVFIILPFPRCHIIRIRQHVAFSDQLCSLGSSHLGFLHVFSWFDSSFLLSADQYSLVWRYHRLLILSPAEAHLGCFQVVEIMNMAAINIHVQVFGDISHQLTWITKVWPPHFYY